MRIVAGDLRGRRLAAPSGASTRPTGDRARQALFNRLEHALDTQLAGAVVLDAFCGTGALAFEALSRGADRAWLLDDDPRALECARRNAENLGLAARCHILRRDVLRPGTAVEPAGLVFLDPPYDRGLLRPGLAQLAAQGWIAPGATVLAEIAQDEEFEAPPGFEATDRRRYGSAAIWAMRYRPVGGPKPV